MVEHQQLLEECFERLAERLRKLLPGFGQRLVADSTDIKAYSTGRGSSQSDPDARWGAKKTGHHNPGSEAGGEGEAKQGKTRELYYWFGYKLHLMSGASTNYRFLLW